MLLSDAPRGASMAGVVAVNALDGVHCAGRVSKHQQPFTCRQESREACFLSDNGAAGGEVAHGFGR